MKQDFPIFSHHPNLVYLDSAASAQKPITVIEGVSDYLKTDYANVHRGQCSLASRSEELYGQARQRVASWIGAQPEEIIFTGNATDSCNRLVHAIIASGLLREGDEILLSTAEHHANIVPWQMAAEQTGARVVFFETTPEGDIDEALFMKQYTTRTKIVGCSAVSNVFGTWVDITALKSLLSNETRLVVDASQAVPHGKVDVQALGCDFLYFTGHKMGAYTGIGVLRGKAEHLARLAPGYGGWGAIETVTTQGYSLLQAPDKFEPGTPNLVGAVSLMKALDYFQARGGYEALTKHEGPLLNFCLNAFTQLENDWKITLLGSRDPHKKIGLFSFVLPPSIPSAYIGERMGKRDICIRCGWQCTHPLHTVLDCPQGSCRISFRLYTDESDLEKFFSAVHDFLKTA